MTNTNDFSDEQLSDSQLATIVGFQQDNEEDNLDIDAEPVEVQQAAEAQLRQADPRNHFTNSPFWTNPFVKLAAVMAGTSVFAFAGYLLLSSLMKPLPSRQTTLQQFPLPDEKTEEQKQAIEGEVALGDQVRDFEKFSNQPTSTTKTKPKLERKKPEAQLKPPQPVRYQSSPRTYHPQQVVRRPQTIPYQSPPAPVLPVARRPSFSPVKTPVVNPPLPPRQQSTPATTTVDPKEQWMQIAKIGSYAGNNSVLPEAQETVLAEEPPETFDNSSYQQAVYNIGSETVQSDQPQISEDIAPELESPILEEQKQIQQLIKGGTQAKAVLVTPLAWDSHSREQIEDSYTIVLSQPLLAADGSVVLPAETQLVARLRSLSESGIVRLFAVTAFVEQDGQIREIPLPQNVVQIRGAKGKPLIAKSFDQDGSRNRNSTTKRIALGALRGAADFFHGSLEGVVEEGTESLLDDLKAPNSAQLSRGDQNVFYLPAGTDIEVFINQPTNLSIPASGHQTLESYQPETEIHQLSLEKDQLSFPDLAADPSYRVSSFADLD